MAAPLATTRQDTAAPAFPSNRATTSNGGGAFGGWVLGLLGLLVAIRSSYGRPRGRDGLRGPAAPLESRRDG